LRQHLVGLGAWSEAQEEALVAEIDEEVKAAIEVSEATEPPPMPSIFEDVYATLPWHLREQRDELVSGPRAPGHH